MGIHAYVIVHQIKHIWVYMGTLALLKHLTTDATAGA